MNCVLSFVVGVAIGAALAILGIGVFVQMTAN